MKSKTVARFGIIGALIVAACSLDALMSIALFPTVRVAVSVLIISITVMQLFDFKTALYAGTVWGLVSFVFAYISPNLASPAFRNPLVSVLPRMAAGVAAYFVFYGMKKWLKGGERWREYTVRCVSAIAAVLTNTGLVITAMMLVSGQDVLTKLLAVIVSTNFIVEISTTPVVVPVVSYVVWRVLKRLGMLETAKQPVATDANGDAENMNDQDTEQRPE